MELRSLGPLDVLDDGAPVDVGGSRPRTLLIDLALAQGHPVPADQLLEDVWSGERIPARNNLQVHVSRLRRALGEDRIATRGGGYALDLPRDALDAARFDRLSAEGRAVLHAGDAETAAATILRDALALWRGAALVDFAEDAFAQPVITRLEGGASWKVRHSRTTTDVGGQLWLVSTGAPTTRTPSDGGGCAIDVPWIERRSVSSTNRADTRVPRVFGVEASSSSSWLPGGIRPTIADPSRSDPSALWARVSAGLLVDGPESFGDCQR